MTHYLTHVIRIVEDIGIAVIMMVCKACNRQYIRGPNKMLDARTQVFCFRQILIECLNVFREALFKKMYGNTSAAVGKQLTTVDWFGQKLKFSSTNGAADSLRAVAREIAQHPDLIKYAKPSAGTFYWRTVRGAKRLSAHSFGIAIDVCTSRSNYWRWDYPGRGETAKIGYRNSFPHQLAEIFARHGFIWGGNWYHYDTMHFEFRPEYFVEW